MTDSARLRPAPAVVPAGLTRSLIAWVSWMVRAYDFYEHWPDCWYRHEGLVIQLLALRRWYVALGAEQSSDLTAAIAWHDALHRLNDRTLAIAQSCLASHHPAPDLSGDEAKAIAWLEGPEPPRGT
jgi:hypothetical protein